MSENIPGDQLGGPAGSSSVYQALPSNVEVTSVVATDGEPDLTPAEGEDFVVGAEGYIQWDGSRKMVVLQLGDAELVLTYDTNSEESATNAAILMMSAPQAMAEVDGLEQENPDEDYLVTDRDEVEQEDL